jgi:hypothetical protein
MLNAARHLVGTYASVVAANVATVAYATDSCDVVLCFHSATLFLF